MSNQRMFCVKLGGLGIPHEVIRHIQQIIKVIFMSLVRVQLRKPLILQIEQWVVQKKTMCLVELE